MRGRLHSRLRDWWTELSRSGSAAAEDQAALAYAEEQHAGQRRKVDGAPFIEHPVEVASLLYDAGASDDVIAAGVLHDTLEKTRTDLTELRARFGSRTAALVAAVSEDESIGGYATRKAALRRQVEAAGTEAMMVFAADKVSKVRELAVAAGGERGGAAGRDRLADAAAPADPLPPLPRAARAPPRGLAARSAAASRARAALGRAGPPPGARRRRLTGAAHPRRLFSRR